MGSRKEIFHSLPWIFCIERLLVPSHRGRAVSGARVSPESSPGFLAVGESRALLSLQIGLPAHLVVETGGAVQSNPVAEKGERDPDGGRSLGENYGEGILRGAAAAEVENHERGCLAGWA